MDPVEMWPMFGLRIVTPRLELRSIDPTLSFALADLAAGGIHDPDFMPFLMPWTDTPPPELQRESLRFYWSSFAGFRAEEWRLGFAVFENGVLVGSQDILTKDYATLRTFETGSWLGRAHQGTGIGKEMRAAVLHFMFAELDAEEAMTGAFVDNAPSIGVTRSLGYEDNGTRRMNRRGAPATEQLFRLSRDRWAQMRRHDITVDGLTDECRNLLVP